MIGWIQEGRSEAQYREADWSGVQSIPRVLTLLDDSRLSFEPVKEIQHLRRQHYHAENLTLADALPYRSDVEGNQLEILLECQPGDAEEIGVVLAQSPGGEEHTRIVFNRENGELYVDRRCSNARGDVDLETQYAALALRSGEGLKLHIFFDRSVIEIYANDRVCLTSRIYPTRADSRGVSFFARGGSVTLRSVDVWKLASAWE
jgi:beta-fructofuranosidase